MTGTPYIIGIAGPSCSGKSEIAKHILRQFSQLNPAILNLDSYYHDLSPLDPAERHARNFDVPEALDRELLRDQVLALANGRAVEIPIYDFATHTRLARTNRVVPGETVIVEGLFALYWETVRNLFHARVFVNLRDRVCLSRRIARDTKERGRSRESVLCQYRETVQPMNEKYVLPTKAFADIVVDGEDPPPQSTAAIMTHFNSVRGGNCRSINSNPGMKDGIDGNIV